MKCWLTYSEWYPVLMLSAQKDIATDMNYEVEIPQDLWDEWQRMERDFHTLQVKLGKIPGVQNEYIPV